MDVLVTYDVETMTPAGERRLRAVAKVCERYGTRVQYSVFEVRIGPTSFVQFCNAISDVIEPADDSVNIYRFDGPLQDRRLSLGRKPDRNPGEPWLL